MQDRSNGNKLILVVCADPGGAAAMLPVALRMLDHGCRIKAVVSGAAVDFFDAQKHRFDVSVVDDSMSLATAEQMIRNEAPDLLFSGAGSYNMIEHTLRVVARNQRVICVALLDYWNEYGARFKRRVNGSLKSSFPDKICVPDGVSADAIVKVTSVASSDVLVVGLPALEKSYLLYGSINKSSRAVLRRKFDIGESDSCAVFFSDPYYVGPNDEIFEGGSAAFDRDGHALYGYVPDDMLCRVMTELEMAAVTLGQSRRIRVLVKPHPREHSASLLKVVQGREWNMVCAEVGESWSVVELLAVADVVFGMGSVVLLEAAIAGKPVVSVQIGLKEKDVYDPCIGNSLGLTMPVFHDAELKEMVRKFIQGDLSPMGDAGVVSQLYEGCTQRVADVIMGCL